MSVTKLPSGRWRGQVYHDGRNLSVGTFATKREAKAAVEDKRRELSKDRSKTTVADFAARWTTDPLFARPKESTMLHNAERVRGFVARYGDVPMADVSDEIVGEWLAGGEHRSTVPSLRAMFNDASSAKAGRVVRDNPFARLGIRKSRGNRLNTPPSEEQVRALIQTAHRVSCPSFAGWLQVAAFTGMRPGELDALRWSAIDLEGSRIRVKEQFNPRTRTFTTPKNGQARWAPMLAPAREALLAAPRESEFCFVNLRRHHWTGPSRTYHWKTTRAAAEFDGSLYMATRHFFGSFAINVLELDSEDVAIALGHTDGGYLVRTLYGHRDEGRALDRLQRAFEARENVRPLRIVKGDAG